MLIRRAEVWRHGLADVRIAGGRIAEMGALEPLPGEPELDARGGALLPGLHDHHLHLAASAVRRQSVICGPPEITGEAQLASRVAAAPGEGWLRGILYHESVMGLPQARELDRICPTRPLRVQHRSGRLWLFNSAGLEALLALGDPPPGLERQGGNFTGHLFDEDAWLRKTLGSAPPDLAEISSELARMGVTGLTDMSPSNDSETEAWFQQEAQKGRLLQRAYLAGTLDLPMGPAKLHLHENALPDFDDTVELISAAHAAGRPLASHCTTETELVFTLAALEAAGVLPGDRIEHAGIARNEHIAQIAAMGLAVVGQPHFIAERGDQYLTDVEPELVSLLYRQASFLRAGVVLAGGSDAPFGSIDPWAAMRSAMDRRTVSGTVIGPDEALTAEQALALFLADPQQLGVQRQVAVKAAADLCLLAKPWNEAREALDSGLVSASIINGNLVHQTPFERGSHGNPST